MMTSLEFRVKLLLNGSLRCGKDLALIERIADRYEQTSQHFGKKTAEGELSRTIAWHRECREVLGIEKHSNIFRTGIYSV
jgi:hypothetical protein